MEKSHKNNLKRNKRDKSKSRVMQQIQIATTEKVHKPKIVDVWVDGYCDCPECGKRAYIEESNRGKYFIHCEHCHYEDSNI